MALYLAVFLFGLVLAGDNFQRIDSIFMEPQCSSAGGMCTIAKDCPRGKLTEKQGLCPRQRSKGVECCYGISVKETRCAKHGGDCVPKGTCVERFTVKEASDCQGLECCVYV